MRERPERWLAPTCRIAGRNAARVTVLLLFWSGRAAAQSGEAPRSQSALAEALFQEGKAQLEQGNLALACAKLSESFRVEAALGTLLNLAVCHEREGKTASAWSEYADALALAERSKETERAEFARLRVEELRPRVPRLQLRILQPEVRLQIQLDGQVLGDGARDSAIPLDPGLHRLEASAVGRTPWHTTVEIATDSGTRVLEVPPLGVEAAAPAQNGPAKARATRGLPAPAQPVQALAARRTWGMIAGAMALAGFGAGTFWGLRTASKQRVVEDNCDDHLCRNDVGLAADRAAHQAATWADISFGAGLAAGALSAYLLLSSTPPAHRALAHTAPRSRFLALGPAELSFRATTTSGGIHARVSF